MNCKDVFKYIEDWAPKEIAWDKDNVGLQVGNGDRKIRNVILCLDVSMNVINEAIKKKCNLIISHHPLLFRPVKRIDTLNDKNSKMIEKLIKNNISLYSAHTNLDFTKDGVSFQLAKILKLNNINFLHTFSENEYKLSVFLPMDYLDEVSEAIFKSGGGKIGEYTNCSFRTLGQGTFKGSSKSKPAIGKKEIFEEVEEVKLEVVVPSWKINKTISALKAAHPYEEPAFDIEPLKNENSNTCVGAIGNLSKPMNVKKFLHFVSSRLKAKNLRYTTGRKKNIKKVAVCGGSCSELIEKSIYAGADAFITADIKYHSFQDAEKEILLIDAGHYETEIHALNEIEKRLKLFLENNHNTRVFKFSGSTNPVLFYNN